MSKTISISDENVTWLKSMCETGSFNDAILILKTKVENINTELNLFKGNFDVINRNFQLLYEKLEQKIDQIVMSKIPVKPNIPEKIIYKSPDEVVLDQSIIDETTKYYHDHIGGNYQPNLERTLREMRQKAFDKQQKELKT